MAYGYKHLDICLYIVYRPYVYRLCITNCISRYLDVCKQTPTIRYAAETPDVSDFYFPFFITELTFWLRQFNNTSNLNSVSLKVFMVLPSLLLQKPSPRSKAKDHTECLTRRMAAWKSGDITSLIKESRHIQSKLTSSKKPRSMEDIAKIFAKLIMIGKVSAALKFLDSESSGGGGVLELSEEVINSLKAKHPNSRIHCRWVFIVRTDRTCPTMVF